MWTKALDLHLDDVMNCAAAATAAVWLADWRPVWVNRGTGVLNKLLSWWVYMTCPSYTSLDGIFILEWLHLEVLVTVAVDLESRLSLLCKKRKKGRKEERKHCCLGESSSSFVQQNSIRCCKSHSSAGVRSLSHGITAVLNMLNRRRPGGETSLL